MIEESYDWAGCTGLTASWCPRCGDCTCDRQVSMSDEECPLHNPHSDHALPHPDEVTKSLMRHPHLAHQVYKKLHELFQTPPESDPFGEGEPLQDLLER